MNDLRIRVAIADDHPVVRRGLRAFLDTQADLVVVAEVADGTSVVSACIDTSAQVVLLDLLMPGGGAEAVAALHAACPALHIIVLTSSDDPAQALAALRAGALSYLLKDSAPELLHAAIADAARGVSVVHPRIATLLVSQQRDKSARPTLSAREQDVLDLIAAGASNAEIGVRLGIGIKTVKTHVSNLLAKLEVADRTQAAVLALRAGLTRR